MKKTILRFFSSISHKWWIFWSNFRFRKSERFVGSVLNEDKADTVTEIRKLNLRLLKKFNYTNDGVDQLFDAVLPPPQAYKDYLTDELKDDCDGFHALMLNCLRANDIECYLLTVTAWRNGHCVLVFNLNGLWHVADYDTVYSGHKELQEAIDRYNVEYPKVYNINQEVFYNSLVDYDYAKGKYKITSVKKIMKKNASN